MPLNGRDVLDLAALQPGVTEKNDDSWGAGSYSIGGGRSDSVTYLLDGGTNNDLEDNSHLLDPNPDAIAEFRLLTNNYTAEYGRNGGGIISVEVKSGTNQYHGSLFEFFRNRVLDANDYFANQQGLPRQDLKRNQYGATFGGPIRKSRAFFFLAYQGQRQLQAALDTDAAVFTPAELRGDFSQALNGGPDPGVVAFLEANPYFQPDSSLAAQGIIGTFNPATNTNNVFDPVAQAYINAGMIPTSPSGLLTTQQIQVSNTDELTGKFDFNLHEKDKISVTEGVNRIFNTNAWPWASVAGFPAQTDANYYFTNIAYTRIFSPTLLNEFHFVAHRSNYLDQAPTRHWPTPAELGIGVTPDLTTGPTNLWFSTGLALGDGEHGPTRYVENTFSWTDAVSWTRGKHNLKFGSGFTAYQENMFYDYITNGEFDFYGVGGVGSQNAYADFLMGIPGDYYQGALAPSNIRSKNTYVFAQDEWHARKNLTLTLGLRYEYNTPKSDTKGRLFSVIPGLQSRRFVNAPPGMVFPGDPGAPWGTNFPDKTNFAPRLGFAWDPTGRGKTSLRGGFGIFYDILKGEDNLQYNGQQPFVSNAGIFFTSPNYLPNCGNPPCPVTAPLAYLSQPFQNACVWDANNNCISQGVPNPFPSAAHPPGPDYNFSAILPINSTGFVYLDDPHLRTPHIYQYNLSLQQSLPAGMVLEANWAGTASRGLTALKDINPMVLGTYNRVLNLVPGNSTCGATVGVVCYQSLPEFGNLSNANYNALEASLTRQPKPSSLGTAYFTLAYTFGHSLDNSSGFTNRSSEVPAYATNLRYASSDFDIRQRISFSGGWDLPFEKTWSNGPKRLTKGWSLYPIVTWRTGLPFDINAQLPDSGDPGNPGTSGAGDPWMSNAVELGPRTTYDPHQIQTINVLNYNSCPAAPTAITGNYYFNPNSFSNVPLLNSAYYGANNPCFPAIDPVANPADRTYGLPRNVMRGPGRINVDLAVAKTTAISERVSLEFRVEFFNALNHTEMYQVPNANLNSATFGQMLYTEGPRVGQLGARLTF
jgi:hypothetical protein